MFNGYEISHIFYARLFPIGFKHSVHRCYGISGTFWGFNMSSRCIGIGSMGSPTVGVMGGIFSVLGI